MLDTKRGEIRLQASHVGLSRPPGIVLRGAALGRDAICVERTSAKTAGAGGIERQVFLLKSGRLQRVECLAELLDLVAVREIKVRDDRGEQGRVQWRTVYLF